MSDTTLRVKKDTARKLRGFQGSMDSTINKLIVGTRCPYIESCNEKDQFNEVLGNTLYGHGLCRDPKQFLLSGCFSGKYINAVGELIIKQEEERRKLLPVAEQERSRIPLSDQHSTLRRKLEELQK